METVWPQMTRLNLNTVLMGMAWAWVEPEEGKFDFTLVDGLLEGARKNNHERRRHHARLSPQHRRH
jgi:beta-galactosidase GanA